MLRPIRQLSEMVIHDQQLEDSALASQVLLAVNLVPKMDRVRPVKDTASAALLLSGGFGSRGSVMLKAALADRSRQDDRATAKRVQEEERRRLRQQVLSARKCSPGSRVLFSEPVVTDHYEYEQTPLVDIELEQNSLSDEERLALRRAIQLKRCRMRIAKPLSENHKRGRSQTSPPKAVEDDEEDEFTLAPSMLPDMDLSRIKSGRQRNKRSHDSITSSEDEESRSADSSHSRSEGGLFSSPKIAKIAPYYHDTTGEIKTTNESASKAPNLEKLRRAPSPLHVKSRNVRKSQASRSMENIQAHSSFYPANSELLPAETAETHQNIVDQSPYNYFNWFNSGLSYISNHISRVNKLLF